MPGPEEKPRCYLPSNGYIFRRPSECSKTCDGAHYEKGRYNGRARIVCMKILTTEERIVKEKKDKERNEWRNATPDICQHNWESDEDYAKRLEQSFEDYKKSARAKNYFARYVYSRFVRQYSSIFSRVKQRRYQSG